MQMLKDPLSRTSDFSSLKCLFNAAAPLKSELATQVEDLVGCPITQWYGMTEASPSAITQTIAQLSRIGSIGKLLPGLEMVVVDEDNKECATLQSGEICLRGPNIMQGYLGQIDASSSSLNGFFRTGDIGYVDRDGFVFLVDRAKEMIKVKGHQVAPAELEAILLSHPEILDAAVKGVYRDDIASEVPIGFLVSNIAQDRQRSLVEELQRTIREKVAPYKRIVGGLHFISEIPRNPSGKVLRRLLPSSEPLLNQAKL
ncbi:putative 4-coumarate--CoA ligase 1 [Cyphellophora attinorum]|uniref:Putative 4-coumarate--CoA ligase 1 n=1 Tax=Cyphellophora attinorum TaxID=1664694 RepID=A0A0N1P0V7_9EURO|nr:putative 4-coumarate--CoA ligase 1 [Phialophora attinorum]KPI40683.1 putative 4-coumarate--CoA ligase 1 [Phialophora attinorum]